jgi:copper(I)-binding protein
VSPTRHRVAALAMTAAALSGCGVGLHAQTYTEQGRQDGTNVDLQTILVRNLHIEAAPSGDGHAVGADAVLTGSVINRGETADLLTAVTSDAATTVSLTENDAPSDGIALAPGGAAHTWSALLQGLTKPLRAGQYVTVTLSFIKGGQTTLSVPVHVTEGQLENREVNQEPYGSEG